MVKRALWPRYCKAVTGEELFLLVRALAVRRERKLQMLRADSDLSKTIAVIASLDTKGREVLYVKERIERVLSVSMREFRRGRRMPRVPPAERGFPCRSTAAISLDPWQVVRRAVQVL